MMVLSGTIIPCSHLVTLSEERPANILQGFLIFKKKKVLIFQVFGVCGFWWGFFSVVAFLFLFF